MSSIPSTMRAVVVQEPDVFDVREIPVPSPQANEVLVQVALCGICGTDLHVMSGEYAPVRYPVIPGHEFAGTVVAVGTQVNASRIGARVVVDPSLYCGTCEFCTGERENLCESGGGLGTTADGAAAEFVAVDESLIYEIPDSVPFEDAVLIEPLACVVHAFELLAGRPLGHTLVFGAGTMGLLVASVARARGAASVNVVDRNPARLSNLDPFGFDAVATQGSELSNADSGWETVIDCTGVPAAIEDALSRVRRGGRYLQFGVPDPSAEIRFAPFRLFKEEISLTGSRAVRRNFPEAIELLATGAIPCAEIVSDAVSLERYEEGTSLLVAGRGRKIIIDIASQ